MENFTTKQRFFIILLSCFFGLFMFYLNAKYSCPQVFLVMAYTMVLNTLFNLVMLIDLKELEEAYDFISNWLHGSKSASPNETSFNR